MSESRDNGAISSTIGVILMVVLTVVLATVIGTFVLGAIYPDDKPAFTIFDFKVINSSSVLITNMNGNSVLIADGAVVIDGQLHLAVTGADHNGDGYWGNGESLILAGLDLVNTTMIDITSGKSVLYTYEVPHYATPEPAVTPAPTSTPTPTPLPLPVANFSADTSVPLKATFTDLSSNAVAWIWNFGDGTFGAVQNPVRNYLAAGTYSVTLTVYNGDGASNSTTKSVVIAPGAPTPTPVPTATPTAIPPPAPTSTPVPTPVPTPIPGPFTPGIIATYYDTLDWNNQLAWTDTLTEIELANAFAQSNPPSYYYSDIPNWPNIGRDTNFSAKFEGYIKIASENDYTFYLTVDDDGALFIDNAFVIGLGGTPGDTKTGLMHLAAGYHSIRVITMQTDYAAVARLEYSNPVMPKQFVTELYH